MSKRPGSPLEMDTKGQKKEVKVKSFFWNTTFDTAETFTITLPKGFLDAILEDDSLFPLNELNFEMYKIKDVLALLGIVNTKS